jgi:glutamate N-acetyltransferase/amino-acid N-acetyltransferase
MATVTAHTVDCGVEQVLVASTGVIGLALDLAKVANGIGEASRVLDRESHRAAAEAIMTTDREPKETAVRLSTATGSFLIGGMVKGAGMIEPRMATMLGFLTTDAAVDAERLHQALVAVNEDTFNAITVDGETSTNDTAFLLANGSSGVTIDDALYPVFVSALRDVARTLAKEVVRGGEGATKLITVRVIGAQSYDEAKRTARAIGNSPLVKTAIHGGDPNWGRLVAVAGRAGVSFELARARVQVGPAVLFADETIHTEREPAAARHLRGREVEIILDLGTGGEHQATMWTCDFSAEYIHINADYRT